MTVMNFRGNESLWVIGGRGGDPFLPESQDIYYADIW